MRRRPRPLIGKGLSSFPLISEVYRSPFKPFSGTFIAYKLLQGLLIFR